MKNFIEEALAHGAISVLNEKQILCGNYGSYVSNGVMTVETGHDTFTSVAFCTIMTTNDCHLQFLGYELIIEEGDDVEVTIGENSYSFKVGL